MRARALLLLPLLVLAGCKTSGASGGWGWATTSEPAVRVESGPLTVPLGLDQAGAPIVAELGSDLYLPPKGGPWPGVVILPGGGRVSRKGTRTSDGTREYEAPVDVSAAWGTALAEAGWMTLAYDKRTCGPVDDPGCAKQPQTDLDADGPLALAKDLDAACDLLTGRPDFNGELVLFAHGQAAQIALSGRCAARAKAIVLIAPIPRGVDQVVPDALRFREKLLLQQAKRAKDPKRREQLSMEANQLKNQAATLAATFQSMKDGRFAEDARVQGATLSFWKGWIALTEQTPVLAQRAEAPLLIVVGEWDLQYSDEDKKRILALAGADDEALTLEKSDHHLLRRDELTPEVTAAIIERLEKLTGHRPAS